MMQPDHAAALTGWAVGRDDSDEDGGFPGPLVRKLVLVAVAAVLLSGALAVWLVSRAAGQEAMQRLVSQQNDEVELVARLLASKIEQSHKVLATVADGITPGMLDSPSSLEWLLRQGLPAVRFFDAMQVARKDGTLSVNLRYGRLEPPSELDPTERDYLLRTLVSGKPLVSDLIGTTPADARVMFTMPLLRGEGRVIGAVAGVLRLQSQGLLAHSLALPARSESRLIVFTREGVILSHPHLERVLGHVQDEPGLAPAYARWRETGAPQGGREAGYVVSLASVPMPEWVVARVSDEQAVLAPLHGAQRRAWWMAAGAVAVVCALGAAAMAWLARPLWGWRSHQPQEPQSAAMHQPRPQPEAVPEDSPPVLAADLQPTWERSRDPLTQLLNRPAFEQRLRVLLAKHAERADGAAASGVLLFLNVDHFTAINDLAGHEAGDDALRHLARLIESEVRQSGWAARLRGDEFAVLLPASTPASGAAVAERLRAAVQAWEASYGGHRFTLSLSIGLVPLAPGLRDVRVLLHAADMACRAAKRAGRNRVVVREAREGVSVAP